MKNREILIRLEEGEIENGVNIHIKESESPKTITQKSTTLRCSIDTSMHLNSIATVLGCDKVGDVLVLFINEFEKTLSCSELEEVTLFKKIYSNKKK